MRVRPALKREACTQVQRRAVREWDIVKSLFGLLWEPHTQLPALRMVRTQHLGSGWRAVHALPWLLHRPASFRQSQTGLTDIPTQPG